jgi:hypothetical protein
MVIGSGFAKVSAVRFGSKKAKSFKVDSTTKLVAISPAGSGTVDVTVTVPTRTSTRGVSGAFAYLAIPAVARIVPVKGPTRGGTTVTLIGSGFTNVSAVRFGSRKARSFKVDSKSKIVAVSPAGSGSVLIAVTTPGGASTVVAADRFRYQ